MKSGTESKISIWHPWSYLILTLALWATEYFCSYCTDVLTGPSTRGHTASNISISFLTFSEATIPPSTHISSSFSVWDSGKWGHLWPDGPRIKFWFCHFLYLISETEPQFPLYVIGIIVEISSQGSCKDSNNNSKIPGAATDMCSENS